jgi:hypothetical protein
MSIFDGILGQVGQNIDIKNLAAKVGLSPEQVESAVGALAKAHPQPGDTAEGAASATGLPLGKVQEIVGHIGGEGALANFASLVQQHGGGILGALDKDDDGNPLDDMGNMISGLFGKK